MVAFYNAALDANLEAMEPMPGFYMGKLAGHGLIVCPNEVAEVVAEQNFALRLLILKKLLKQASKMVVKL